MTRPAHAWRVPRSAPPRPSPVPPGSPWPAAGGSSTRRRSARSPAPPTRTPGRGGEGTGTALRKAPGDEADNRGYEEVLLEVREDNPRARRLYLRHGFTEVGIRRGYYQPSGVDAVVMRKGLR